MKLTKLLMLAVCVTLCFSYNAFAEEEEDDFIAESTPTTIADPVNPQPGVVFKGYNLETQWRKDYLNLPATLDKSAAAKTTVVKTENFSWSQFKDTAINQGVWEGFLKCKRSATCTILIKQSDDSGVGCFLFVNGKKVLSGSGQQSVDVDLKAGFNFIKVVTQRAGIAMYLSPKDSTKDPKPVSPAIMFHDEKPEEDVI